MSVEHLFSSSMCNHNPFCFVVLFFLFQVLLTVCQDFERLIRKSEPTKKCFHTRNKLNHGPVWSGSRPLLFAGPKSGFTVRTVVWRRFCTCNFEFCITLNQTAAVSLWRRQDWCPQSKGLTSTESTVTLVREQIWGASKLQSGLLCILQCTGCSSCMYRKRWGNQF